LTIKLRGVRGVRRRRAKRASRLIARGHAIGVGLRLGLCGEAVQPESSSAGGEAGSVGGVPLLDGLVGAPVQSGVVFLVWRQPFVASQVSSVQASPSLQSPQVVHSFAPAVVANVPAAHGVHSVALSVALKVPGSHCVQAVSVLPAQAAFLNEPARQIAHGEQLPSFST